MVMKNMKNPIQMLTENTGVSFSLLAVGVGLIIGAVGWAWQQSAALNDIRYELKELRTMIQTQWTRQDQEIWAMQLALKNPGIEVPFSTDPNYKAPTKIKQ